MEPILEICYEEEYQAMNNARSRIVILEKLETVILRNFKLKV